MAAIIIGALVTAIALIYQAIWAARTGRLSIGRSGEDPTISPAKRAGYLMLYMIPALAIIGIVTNSMVSVGLISLEKWMRLNGGMLFISLCFIVIGLLALARPEETFGSVIRQHPELKRNRNSVLLMRCLGAGFIIFGFVIARML